MATDRELLKQAQSGHIASTGAADPIGEVGKAHEETFIFEVDADAALAERGVRIDKKCKVVRAYFTPSTALAAHATAYTTYTVAQRDGAGGAATTIAEFDTATGGDNVSLAAFVPQSFLTGALFTASALALAAGSVLTVKTAEASTPTSPLGTFSITVEYV